MEPAMSWIKNSEELLAHGNRAGREIVLAALEAGLTATDPYERTKALVHVDGDALAIADDRVSLAALDRIYVVGAGKGSYSICRALEETLGDRLTAGVLSVKADEKRRLQRIRVIEAGHPVLDERSVDAGNAILALARAAGPRDLVFAAITGGASALMEVPVPEITLADLQRTNELLLNAGTVIADMNAVRKHLSQLKGGRLVTHALPARVVTITLGTVPEGLAWPDPTKPDASTFKDAVAVLERQGLWTEVPVAVRAYLERGTADRRLETPKDFGDGVVPHLDVGNQAMACEAAAAACERLGITGIVLATNIVGEAQHVGTALIGIAKEIHRSNRPFRVPCALVSGGEVTATVTNPSGIGGPNQEFVMGAARLIGDLPVVVTSIDTDGSDGPTDMAGAIADGGTLSRAELMDIDLAVALRRNDTGRAFRRLGDAIVTGPTGTNVVNLRVILVGVDDRGRGLP
jgi:glycerate 2-kinase